MRFEQKVLEPTGYQERILVKEIDRPPLYWEPDNYFASKPPAQEKHNCMTGNK